MKHTGFWLMETQVQRLAKSHKPNAAGTGLEEIRITQLRYPLTDRFAGAGAKSQAEFEKVAVESLSP